MFKFVWPWLFVIIPLPLVMYYLLPRAKIKQVALKLPHYEKLSQLSMATTQLIGSSARLWLVGLIWVFLVVASAGPQWLSPPQSIAQSGRDIMLAVDLSGSMQTPDMQYQGQRITRIQMIKAVATKFIKDRAGDKLGLILFGSKAYLQTPLTFDKTTVAAMLNDATVGLAGQQTAIGDAIGLAIKRLSKVPKGNRVLILLTDGASNAGVVEPIEAAKMAAKMAVKIFTVGIGADQVMVQTVFGPKVMAGNSDLDENTLQQIAKLTGGLYFRATDGSDLQQVYQRLNKIVPIVSDKTSIRLITALYFWPLAAAIILSLLLALSYVWPFGLNWRDAAEDRE